MTFKRKTQTRPKRILVGGICLVLLSGCAVSPVPITDAQFLEQARQDLAVMFSNQEPVTEPLTFNDVLVRTLSYNLDRRSKMMEEALALGQLDLDRFNLLPSIVASAGYDNRSEPNASTSRDLNTQEANDASPTYSSDRDTLTAELGLTWNILDFGVSYYVAKQNADRALIASERRRRTIQNLEQEVRFAFWKAAAAQILKGAVEQAVSRAEKALIDAERVELEGLQNPVTALQTQKTLLENIRQLEAIDQELNSAQAELSALMAMPPGVEYTLDIGSSMVVPNLAYTIEQMEEMALANNPEIREQDYLSRISINETRKEIVKLLPGVSLSFSQQHDSNSFLTHSRWTQAGAAVTWNLLNIFSAPGRIEHAEKAEEVAKAKRLALRMAVLTQVHVGTHQLSSAIRQFGHADRLWNIESRLLIVSRNQQEGGAQSPIERVTMETSAIAAQLRRYSAFARAQAAFGKMQATLGLDPNPTLTNASVDAKEQKGESKNTAATEQQPDLTPAAPSRGGTTLDPYPAAVTAAETSVSPSLSEVEQIDSAVDDSTESETGATSRLSPPPEDVNAEAAIASGPIALVPTQLLPTSDDVTAEADPNPELEQTALPSFSEDPSEVRPEAEVSTEPLTTEPAELSPALDIVKTETKPSGEPELGLPTELSDETGSAEDKEPNSSVPNSPTPDKPVVKSDADVEVEAVTSSLLSQRPEPAGDDARLTPLTLNDKSASLSHLSEEVMPANDLADMIKPNPKAYYVATSGLNVRTSPDANGEIVGIALRCEEVTVINRQWGWSQITVSYSDNRPPLKGWSDKRFLVDARADCIE